jgi:hypothetical protein
MVASVSRRAVAAIPDDVTRRTALGAMLTDVVSIIFQISKFIKDMYYGGNSISC